jgi:hypothetical protein
LQLRQEQQRQHALYSAARAPSLPLFLPQLTWCQVASSELTRELLSIPGYRRCLLIKQGVLFGLSYRYCHIQGCCRILSGATF